MADNDDRLRLRQVTDVPANHCEIDLTSRKSVIAVVFTGFYAG